MQDTPRTWQPGSARSARALCFLGLLWIPAGTPGHGAAATPGAKNAVRSASEAAGQDPDQQQQERRKEPDPVPELSSREQKRVGSILRGLRRGNEKQCDNARQELIGLGRGVLPSIADGFGHATSRHAVKSLRAAVDKLTDERDFAWFRTWSRGKAEELRLYALDRLGSDPRDDATACLKDGLKDKVQAVQRQAAAHLASRGDPAGFDILVRHIAETDGRSRAALLRHCEGFHTTSAPVHAVASRLLTRDQPQAVRVAACEALGAARASGAVSMLGKTLDHTEHRVQEAAVNALRRLLEDKDPVQTVTAFELIEEIERVQALVDGHKNHRWPD